MNISYHIKSYLLYENKKDFLAILLIKRWGQRLEDTAKRGVRVKSHISLKLKGGDRKKI